MLFPRAVLALFEGFIKISFGFGQARIFFHSFVWCSPWYQWEFCTRNKPLPEEIAAEGTCEEFISVEIGKNQTRCPLSEFFGSCKTLLLLFPANILLKFLSLCLTMFESTFKTFANYLLDVIFSLINVVASVMMWKLIKLFPEYLFCSPFSSVGESFDAFEVRTVFQIHSHPISEIASHSRYLLNDFACNCKANACFPQNSGVVSIIT